MIVYMIEYAFGNVIKEDIIDYLEMKKVNKKKELAPPSGLYLQKIIYDEKVFDFHTKNIDEINTIYHSKI